MPHVSRGRRKRELWLLALPALLLLALFFLYPLVQLLRYAGWQWSGLSAPLPVGWQNLSRLWHDPEFWRSLRITAKVALCTLPPFIVLSYAIAFAIEGRRSARLVKALLFLPSLVTVAGSAIAWYLLYDPDYGFVSELSRQLLYTIPCQIGRVPLPCNGLALPWRSAEWAGIVYVSIFSLWQMLGYGVLIVSAGLQGIPVSLREAAKMDGANAAQVRWHIVVPLLRSSLIILLALGTVLSIQSYTAVFLLTEGAPFGGTRVLGYYLYELGFRKFELGYAAALTLVMLALTLVLVSLQLLILRRDREG